MPFDIKKALEKSVLEELKNIKKNEPLFPGDTISHGSAEACISRGWAQRNEDGNFIITDEGRKRLLGYQ